MDFSFLFSPFRGSSSRQVNVSRRAFLRNVAIAAPAAVAAAAAIDLKFIPELQAAAKEMLLKLDQAVEADFGLESGKIQVAVPKAAFDPNARLWRSVANEAGAWADYVAAKTGITRSTALRMTTRLATLVDHDLRAAGATLDTKIDLSLPVVTRQFKDYAGNPECEIGIGVHRQKVYDGSEQLAVAFISTSPRILTKDSSIASTVSAFDQKVAARNPDFKLGSNVGNGKGLSSRFNPQVVVYDSLGPQVPLPVFAEDGSQIS